MPYAQVTSLAPAGSFPGGDGTTVYKNALTLSDGTNGTAFSKNQRPPYQVGDQVEYTLGAQTRDGQNLKVKKLQTGGQPTPQQGYAPPPQQRYSPPRPAQTPPAYQPPAIVQIPPLPHGATVGMAIKAGIDLALSQNVVPTMPDFWAIVREYASDICRLSWMLENGQFAPKQGQRQQAAQPPQPPPQQQQPPVQHSRPQPGPAGSAFPAGDAGADEDVPF